VFSKTRFADFK